MLPLSFFLYRLFRSKFILCIFGFFTPLFEIALFALRLPFTLGEQIS